MSRARLFMFATTLSVSAATFACPKETDGGGGGGGGIVQPYGAPPRPLPPDELDAGEETSATPGPTTTTTGAPAPIYGLPPPPDEPTKK